MNIEPGSRVGPYEITETLGEGGMGRVYRAHDSRLGRSVAIKVIQPEVAAHADRLARFEREARLSSSLNHPNIVTIFDFADVDGTAFIAMELVIGESLRKLLKTAPLPLKTALSIAAQLASGLAAAHRVGIVHRDLKPENVMVTPQSTVKILDFGLAKVFDQIGADEKAATQQLVTAGHHVLGTAAYMSPEQARGKDLDFRSDQFSFGLIVYEMLSGRHPFLRASTMETLAAIDRDDPPPLSEVSAEVPEELIWIIERCLQKDPEQRYGSTDDLAIDLMRLRNRSGEMRSTRPRRKQIALWPFAIAAVVLAAIVAGVLLSRLRARPPARQPSYVALHIPGIRISRSPVNTPVAISPDGTRIVIVGNAAGEPPKLWLRNLSSTATMPIAGTEDGYAPSWSRDGKQIAFFAGGKLKIVAVDGGATRTLCDAFSETGSTWNDSGTIVFPQIDAPDGPGLFKIDSRGGPAIRLTRPDPKRGELPNLWPDFLPDGKRFLFVGGNTTGLQATSTQLELFVGSVDGAAPKRLGPIASRVVYRDGLAYYVRDGSLLAQRFDPESLHFSGDPTVVVDRVEYVRDSATAGFSIADNGSICYRTARADTHLVTLDRNGQQLALLGHGVYAAGFGRLSPDGTRVAVGILDPKLGLADLWIYSLTGRAASRITFDTFDERAPVWSRDGRFLYYSIDIQGPPDIFKLDLETNRREPVVMDPGRDDALDLSPDGSTLLYQHFNRASAFDLRILQVGNPARQQTVVGTPFDENDGRFSPDGRWISFTSDVSGKPEVYVVPFPLHGTPVRVSSAGGSTARWRGDGRELTFLGPSGEMMVVSVIATANAIDFGTPQFLFHNAEGIANYELTADGRRFIVQTEEIDPPPPVQLVLR
ncbi:MAG TPA: protein kinase [Thermoanaerobaculia bacterium]|nr:protein kinase [Thermoanaerobaculia bacterium]